MESVGLHSYLDLTDDNLPLLQNNAALLRNNPAFSLKKAGLTKSSVSP